MWYVRTRKNLAFVIKDHNYGAALNDTITRWLKNLCEAGLFKHCSPVFTEAQFSQQFYEWMFTR